MEDLKRYDDMFEYLSEPALPPERYDYTTLVFGRYDYRLAEAMGELASTRHINRFVISGAFGKDSGPLWNLGTPEAKYLAGLAMAPPHNIPAEHIYLDTKPLDGFDGARFGLDVVDRHHLGRFNINVLSHATSLRRLAAIVETEGMRRAKAGGEPTKNVYRIGTKYPFDHNRLADRKEASAELVRLADWSAHGLILEQPDLPEDLLEFARKLVPTAPLPPPKLAKMILRHTPLVLRRKIFDLATKSI